jgi:hypothetical protein
MAVATLSVGVLLAIVAVQLHAQGRYWICSCGYVLTWSGDIWSANNSQHLLDPYSFTHLLNGLILFWLLVWLVPWMPMSLRLLTALGAEALWEVLENSAFMIERYRQATLALGYTGDTVINSLSDILLCAIGFVIALRVGLRRSLALFVLLEVALTIWIRDSLLLNIIMLIHPVDIIKSWQMG